MRIQFVLVVLVLVLVVLGDRSLAQLPPPPVPPQNPITASKAILGKILFWEEQVSSDDTVACGTCHRPQDGGADLRFGQTPGPDGNLGNADDIFGSPGVRRSNAANDYVRDPFHHHLPRATPRSAPTFFTTPYAPELFWDGRAGGKFIDPQDGHVSIPDGGALESVAVQPPTSDIEMAHESRTWAQVIDKLTTARPLALASDLPKELAAVIARHPSYPELFAWVYGDPKISAERFAFAIATYARTLIPDQTPFDRFSQGDSSALTSSQKAGLALFTGRAGCNQCHVLPFFTDFTFANTGVRPPAEDLGRQLVTGRSDDAGKFKIPSLRNVGLKHRTMHNGGFDDLGKVVDFYNDGGGFKDNIDRRLLPLGLSPTEMAELRDFIENALVDPRAAGARPPFDRPALFSERVSPDPLLYGNGSQGSGGLEPQMIAASPALRGAREFRLGVGEALGGSIAALGFAAAPASGTFGGIPINIAFVPPPLFAFVSLVGSQPGEGYATLHARLPDDPALEGLTGFCQWFVADPNGASDVTATRGAQFTVVRPASTAGVGLGRLH